MNTEPTTPAYRVQITYPVQPNCNKSYTFRENDLSASRQAALQQAKQVLAAKQPYEVIDLLIQLVLVERSTISDKPQVIATVFNQRFHRTAFISEGKDLLKDLKLSDFTKRSFPPSLWLALELEQGDEACKSQEFVAKGIPEVPDEFAYYRENGYSNSF